MTNREAFATAMAVLGNTFDRKLTAPAIEGYWLALGDLSEAEFAAATKRALVASKFMPTPSELLAFAGRAPRDIAAEAALAWDAVRKAMDGLDVYGNPDFGPVINAVVRNLGGWVYLCEQKLSELEWRRKDFERVYRLWAEKDASLLPDGGPLFGQWKMAPVTRIEIAGLPLQRPALAAIETPQSAEMKSLVRELAEEKSQTGAGNRSVAGSSPAGGLETGPRSSAAEQAAVPPPRETKPPTRISEEEKAAAVARMAEQFKAREATP